MDAHLTISVSIAAVLGLLLGLERSLAGKHAGMRTYALVALGSALFSAVGVAGSYQLGMFPGINPMQIAGSVAIGIGFIGAGLTAVRGEHAELTTAAGIWLAASIGVACGFGLFVSASVVTVLGILIFSVFARLEYALSLRYKTKREE
jgi:putative Mg2+ transporter-C (MgtC) family protein